MKYISTYRIFNMVILLQLLLNPDIYILSHHVQLKDGKMDEDVVVKFTQEGFERAGATLDEEKFRSGISKCIKQSK
jgi:hypothetical protein